MLDRLKAMLAKKAERGELKKLSDVEKKAKMSVIDALHENASDGMKEKLMGAKKVSVMADSDEGLKKGLDKAKELVEAKAAAKDDSAEEEAEAQEEASEGESEHHPLDMPGMKEKESSEESEMSPAEEKSDEFEMDKYLSSMSEEEKAKLLSKLQAMKA